MTATSMSAASERTMMTADDHARALHTVGGTWQKVRLLVQALLRSSVITSAKKGRAAIDLGAMLPAQRWVQQAPKRYTAIEAKAAAVAREADRGATHSTAIAIGQGEDARGLGLWIFQGARSLVVWPLSQG